MPRFFLMFILTALCGLVIVSPAHAHGFLIRAVPPDGAVLDRSPARAQYWFSESLEPAFSRITVRGPGGVIIAEAGANLDNDALLAVRLPPDLPDGTYLVDLRLAFASDGHVIAESRSFSIGAASGAGGTGVTNQTDPLEMVWRAGTLVGVMLAFGTAVIYNAVLRPAWGSAAYKVGGLPPRVMRRLTQLMWLGLGVAIGAQVLALLQQSSAFFGADYATVLSERLWEVVRGGTRFGQVWNVRMLALVSVSILLILAWFYRTDSPVWVRSAWSSAVPALALALAASSVISHAPGSRAEPWVALFLDWAHLTAAGFWAGGLAALAGVFPVALAPLDPESRRLALLAALRRYSPYAAAALVMVIGSGIFSAALWVRPAELVTTDYGLSLLVKSGLVIGLVILGVIHHAALNPTRWVRLSTWGERLGGFGRTLRIEAIFGLLVLVGAGWLTAQPVPIPPDALTVAPALTDTQSVNGYDVALTVSPGGTGFNTFDVRVERDGLPVDLTSAALQMSYPALDQRPPRVTLDPLTIGDYETANDDLTREGVWWAVLDLTKPDGDILRAAFALDIQAQNTVRQTIPLNQLQTLALIIATSATGYAAWRPARVFYRRLGLSPQGGLIVLATLAASIVAFVLGLGVVAQTSQDYNQIFNAPPDVVNPTLPTQESVARGQAALTDVCGWTPQTVGWDALELRLPRTRDIELYTFTRDGFRGLPACADLSDSVRWDMVNALRYIIQP